MYFRIVVGLTLCASVASAAAPTTLPRLIVKTIEANGIDPARVAPLNELILTEFQNSKRYEVIGGSDLTAMLDNAADKQMLGCDDQECLTEIAGAMNADLLASSSIGGLDGGYLVNVKIISLRDARVIARASIKTDSGDDQLVSGAQLAVRTVTATSSFADRLPSVKRLPIVLWGVGGAALTTGIIFGLASSSAHRDFEDPTYADVNGAKRAGQRDQTIANVAFGTAIVSIGAGLLTWWFGGDRAEVLPQQETVNP